MSKSGLAVGLFVGVAAIATILRFTLFANTESDQDLIRDALKESIQAGKEGRPGSVIDLLSAQFDVNGFQPGSHDIARWVREYKPDLEVVNSVPSVNGETADLVSPVKLKLLTREFEIKGVTFKFQKEETTEWIIFPAKKWHLRSVQVPSDVFTQIADAGLGFGSFGN